MLAKSKFDCLKLRENRIPNIKKTKYLPCNNNSKAYKTWKY